MSNKIYDKSKRFIKENLWFFISLIAIILIFNVELPYSIETPGGYISLKDRIDIEGVEDSSSGELGMAYVSMVKGSIPFLLYSYLNPTWDIISKDKLTYENESMEESIKRDKLYLNEAINNAILVAYKKAGKQVDIKSYNIYVAVVDNETSNLKVGDKIIKINNQTVSNLEEMHDYINNILEDEIRITIIRDNKEQEVIAHFRDYDGEKKVGIAVIANYQLETNPKINITSKTTESGPSGGLMTALGIYSQLSDEDLTKGDKIIGTGTISSTGKVGEIGGVKYKLIGAINKKAKVFICPMENLQEAEELVDKYNYDIELKGVSSFDEAINYLKER